MLNELPDLSWGNIPSLRYLGVLHSDIYGLWLLNEFDDLIIPWHSKRPGNAFDPIFNWVCDVELWTEYGSQKLLEESADELFIDLVNLTWWDTIQTALIRQGDPMVLKALAYVETYYDYPQRGVGYD